MSSGLSLRASMPERARWASTRSWSRTGSVRDAGEPLGRQTFYSMLRSPAYKGQLVTHPWRRGW